MSVQIISSSYLSNHRYFKARKDKYKTKTGKIIEEYFVVEMPSSACAVAITETNEIILIKQYRHGIAKDVIELPGGFVDDNEPKEKAIARELLEETGYQFSEIISLGVTYANPAVLSNSTFLFLAKGGKKIASQHLDDDEEIEIILKSMDEVKEMIGYGLFLQSMHELCLRKAIEYVEENK